MQQSLDTCDLIIGNNIMRHSRYSANPRMRIWIREPLLMYSRHYGCVGVKSLFSRMSIYTSPGSYASYIYDHAESCLGLERSSMSSVMFCPFPSRERQGKGREGANSVLNEGIYLFIQTLAIFCKGKMYRKSTLFENRGEVAFPIKF